MKNKNLTVKEQIKKLEKSIKKYGDPQGTNQKKIDNLKKELSHEKED